MKPFFLRIVWIQSQRETITTPPIMYQVYSVTTGINKAGLDQFQDSCIFGVVSILVLFCAFLPVEPGLKTEFSKSGKKF